MAKLKISKKQYNTILLREQETRLNSIVTTLIENEGVAKAIINEGVKDWALGAALIISNALGNNTISGHNKIVADKAIKNKETMGQIKATIENEFKTQELVDAMEKLGIKNTEDLLAKHAEKVVNEFNRLSDINNIGYHVDKKGINNLEALNIKLSKTYELQEKEKQKQNKKDEKNKGEVDETQPIITVKDRLDVIFKSDSFFVDGSEEISKEGNGAIEKLFNEISNQDGKVINVNVEVSTDTEEILKFKDEHDFTGNIKLAQLRSKNIIDLIKKLSDNVKVTHREIPNNGADVVSTKDYASVVGNNVAIQAIKHKAIAFRYVKLVINMIVTNQVVGDETLPEIIKNYRREIKKNADVKFKNTKFKCKKNNDKQECETF